MKISYKKTGPFKIEKIITDDPQYLIVEFEDINPETGKKSLRKMKKGGQWPSRLAEMLQEKVQNLINQKVIVVTSQTTKNWSTHQWFCNVETVSENEIKEGFGTTKAADGSLALSDTLKFSDKYWIDCSLAQEILTDMNEYEVFYQTVEKQFKSSIRNKNCRFIYDDITRIRLHDKARSKGSQGGFRVTVWKALDMEDVGYYYYVVLNVDRKTLKKKFPEKSEMIEKIKKVKDNYGDQKLEDVVKKTLKELSSSQTDGTADNSNNK